MRASLVVNHLLVAFHTFQLIVLTAEQTSGAYGSAEQTDARSKRKQTEALPNGTLWLGAFSSAQYRSDVHAALYRCRAAGTVGTVLSRDMRLEAG
ncbi:down syndrome cell adhesion molecule [Danaus plexippus plexippus]|uniref:Down syndrome cell adhesion molecule n=1 Tax=Danaus plexippus plexippus TaxID=278856 RepID=A0A212F7V1_DANPL|nr:down syndrome cell adhesion molecule [Danaus plexippus plexippus]